MSHEAETVTVAHRPQVSIVKLLTPAKLEGSMNGMEKKRNIRETRELTATYDQESKGYRRVTIDEGQGIRGVLYFPKDEPVPRMVTILLREDEGSGQGRGR